MTAEPAAPDAQASMIRPADAMAVQAGAAALRQGLLVAFATETVYGLGANAEDGRAVTRIFEAKGRPRFNPLIVHVQDAAAARRQGRFAAAAALLADAFWPGPLTLVVPRAPSSTVAELATAGLASIALRVPGAAMARELIAAAGVPVAAPSANVSGHVSATTAEHAAADLGHAVALVLDAGPTRHGIESTIIGVGEDEAPVLLRAGAVTREAVEAVLGQALGQLPVQSIGQPIGPMRRGRMAAPGQLESHYAPRARLRLDARDAVAGEAFVAFGPPPAGVDAAFTLSTAGDVVEAAANLFSLLRRLDDQGIGRAAFMTIPGTGLGEAINDRLRRAAAPRRRRGRDGR